MVPASRGAGHGEELENCDGVGNRIAIPTSPDKSTSSIGLDSYITSEATYPPTGFCVLSRRFATDRMRVGGYPASSIMAPASSIIPATLARRGVAGSGADVLARAFVSPRSCLRLSGVSFRLEPRSCVSIVLHIQPFVHVIHHQSKSGKSPHVAAGYFIQYRHTNYCSHYTNTT